MKLQIALSLQSEPGKSQQTRCHIDIVDCHSGVSIRLKRAGGR
jgi:hypothetical protein